MTGTKTIRCADCAAEFSEAEIAGANGCPTCGTKSVPCAIEDDVTIKLNWHELRIIGIWASNYAEEKFRDQQGHKTLRAILRRLEERCPDKSPLSLAGELGQLARSGKCGDIELHRADGSVEIIKSEKPS